MLTDSDSISQMFWNLSGITGTILMQIPVSPANLEWSSCKTVKTEAIVTDADSDR